MSRISWQICDISEVSFCIRDTASKSGYLSYVSLVVYRMLYIENSQKHCKVFDYHQEGTPFEHLEGFFQTTQFYLLGFCLASH